MLKRIQPPKILPVRIAEANFPRPFPQTLEYSPAARGTWNIVHTGMRLPESHQIYICAAGCLRGVILSAAEMGYAYRARFSTLELHEEDLYDTDNELFLIEGITEILSRLPKLPRAVLVFTACVHHFLGVNLPYVYRVLRERFPRVEFAECVMDPIRQTKSLTPEERERREIYRLLPGAKTNPCAINLLGGNFPPTKESDIKKICRENGCTLHDFGTEKDFDAFLSEAICGKNLYTNPFSLPAAKDIKRRRGIPYLFLPQVWHFAEIRKIRARLATFLGGNDKNADADEVAARRALSAAQKQIGSRPLAIDYTFTFLPLSLARLLTEAGFSVREIYLDAIAKDDEENFAWLKENAPEILLYPTKHPLMRRKKRGNESEQAILALGQKAAYFTGTRHFVPDVEGGGHYGFEAVTWLSAALEQAAKTAQDTEAIIRRKAYGGPSCL